MKKNGKPPITAEEVVQQLPPRIVASMGLAVVELETARSEERAARLNFYTAAIAAMVLIVAVGAYVRLERGQ